MAKREYTMLAHVYKSQAVGGYLASEKRDGIRCMWDGGISRGLPCSEVPYANTAKDSRYVTPPVATGLWTRYAKSIQAPDWFLDQLPPIATDGELWGERGGFQDTSRAVKKIVPIDEEWESQKYMAFNVQYVRYWLSNGRITNPNMDLVLKGCWEWAAARAEKLNIRQLHSAQNFLNAQKILRQYDQNEVYHIIEQTLLPTCSLQARTKVNTMFNAVTQAGGEGLVITDPGSYWLPERSHHMLKMKPTEDDEGIVVGLTFGSETDKGSKLLGMMGSLLVQWNGKIFSIGGFNTGERELVSDQSNAYEYAATHPEERAPDWIRSVSFPLGTKLTFSYRELTKDGIPKEAKYNRVRSDE